MKRLLIAYLWFTLGYFVASLPEDKANVMYFFNLSLVIWGGFFAGYFAEALWPGPIVPPPDLEGKS